MGREEEDEAERLRELAERLDKKSREDQWHPVDGKAAADAEDETWNAARDKDPTGK